MVGIRNLIDTGFYSTDVLKIQWQEAFPARLYGLWLISSKPIGDKWTKEGSSISETEAYRELWED